MTALVPLMESIKKVIRNSSNVYHNMVTLIQLGIKITLVIYIYILLTWMSQHLINNGFAPEWVMVEKEVRQQREGVRQRLRQARQKLGPLPLTPEEEVL